MSERAGKGIPKRGLEGVISRLLTKAANVSELRDLAPGFRLVTLQGSALCSVSWTPGQKVQLMLGGWVQRTYTPLSWDAERGRTTLLAYAHGDGPGAEWARRLALGDECAIFGPRGSLDLTALERPALLFGDESSFGLAHALRFTPSSTEGVHLLLEVSSAVEASAVLAEMGVQGAQIVQRKPDNGHVGELQERATQLVQACAIRSAVLSGNAASIQKLSKHLRELGIPRARLQTKAYWAQGKKGLD